MAKEPIPDNHAHCARCKKMVEMKDMRTYVKGKCTVCSGVVSKFLGAGNQKKKKSDDELEDYFK